MQMGGVINMIGMSRSSHTVISSYFLMVCIKEIYKVSRLSAFNTKCVEDHQHHAGGAAFLGFADGCDTADTEVDEIPRTGNHL